MQKRTWTLVLFALVLAAAIGSLLVDRGATRAPGSELDPKTRSLDSSEETSSVVLTDQSVGHGAVSSDRKTVQSAGMRLQNPEGAPVFAASATWSTRSAEWDDDSSWPERDWESLLATSHRAESDGDGLLKIEPPAAASARGSRLWVTSSGHAARVLEFPAGSEPVLPSEMTMTPAASISVLVVDASGRPAAGARVRTVCDLDPVDHVAANRAERARMSYLVRDATTDSSGRIELPFLADSQVCWAVLGDLESGVVRAAAPDTVRLALTRVLEVSGRVVATEPLVDLGAAEVSVYATSSSNGDRTRRVRVRGDGSFGPWRVPIVRELAYTLQAQGPGFVVKTVPLDVSQHAQIRTEVEIPVVRGHSVPIRVVETQPGTEPRPVAGAYASALWLDGSVWEKARGLTDEHGRVNVGRLPTREVSFDVRAEGFVPSEGRFAVAADVEPFLEFAMTRGNVLRGRVLDDGRPVREFTIHFWGGNVDQRKSRSFRGRSDGSFQLELPGASAWTLFAVSPDRMRGSEVTVQVKEGGAQDLVVLDVRAPGAGSGRVVDSRTIEPISGATIQVWTSFGTTLIAGFGAPVVTDADGRFDVLGLAPGRNFISIRHDRYADSMQAITVGADRSSDLGVIALSAGASLTVDGGASRAKAECRLYGPSAVLPQSLPPSGVLHFDKLALGLWTVQLILADGRSMYRTVVIDSDTPARVEFNDGAGAEVRVRISVPDGTAVPALGALRAHEIVVGSGSSPLTHQVAASAVGEMTIGPVLSRRVRFVLTDVDDYELAAVLVEDLARAEQPIELAVGAVSKARLVDQEGRPLAATTIAGMRLDKGWSTAWTTGSTGEIQVASPPFDTISLFAHVGDRGYGFVHDVPMKPLPAQIEFDFISKLELRVHDGSVQIAGATAFLMDGTIGEYMVEYLPTDDSGRVAFGPLIAGEYLVRVDHPMVWPKSEKVLVAGSSTLSIEVRRRGSVELTARRDGLPVRDLAIDVRSDEFATSIAPWVAEGSVTSSSTNIRTDEAGRLRIDGIPHGRYQWAARTSDGAAIGGAFVVEPAKRVDIEVQVD